MRVRKLKIFGLYDLFDFDVSFEDNETVIHGINGSGKTGILQVLGWFVTGNIERLANVEFTQAGLEFEDAGGHLIAYQLVQDKRSSKVEIYKNQKKIGHYIRSSRAYGESQEDEDTLQQWRTELSHSLRASFIAVSRYGETRFRTRSIIPKDPYDTAYSRSTRSSLENAVWRAENIFARAQAAATNQERVVLTKLRNDLINRIAEPFSLDDSTKTGEWEERLLSVSEKIDQYSDHGTKLIDIDPDALLEAIVGDDTNKRLAAVAVVQQLERLSGIIGRHFSQVEQIRQRTRSFADALQSFFGDTYKSVTIDENRATLVFTYGEKSLFPRHFSSGEMEIFIMLTYAAFGEDGLGPPELLIIDEPELSLHTAWQERLLPTIRQLNPVGQIIIATHSPEIAATSLDHLVAVAPINAPAKEGLV
ncbi:Predicted ATP-binding protein involved in virulence [Sulfobacillus thermosulfidooxidans DSM 9293]|uniref:Predicted ATP-binding protein involved in virulence n=1 Tax=Sulfobacillus thermosulfidooxidans (strain DSM 9293 / VKM B-1269 / AT-1) TaxID=929705 RepID=A0A1W1WQH9_SULTA|nr:AAA family ATPase [Sulfobacillus thermosulfidooxidans]SMC07983.1 Predicted ATP-binding protein involved in virulence [Sulfobacillus thermosulfidooxidans DSM 9293]